MKQYPTAACLCMAAVLACRPAAGQANEPILTWNAVPNPAGTVSMKFDFVSSVGETRGESTQAIPEARLELGLGHGFETVLQMPLLRVNQPDGSSVLAGGQFSVAVRYLLAGSATAKYAISIGGRLEVPSGDSAIVGSTYQLMPIVLAEWHATPRLLLRSNLAWNTTVGATTGRFAYVQHSNAVVWMAGHRFMPVFEVAGGTSTLNGNSQLVIQPEVIVAPVEHVELKTGFSVRLIPVTDYGIRSQLAWYWGTRHHR